MLNFLLKLFSADFMPHVYCLRDPGLIALHVGSDAVIAGAYFLIPLALILLIRKRPDLVFPWMFGLFGLFILACGTTHLLAIWTLWHPVYRFEGLVKAITAAASALTAFLLFRLVPSVVALPSPAQFRSEIEERKSAESEVRKLNLALEGRVLQRTEELARSNQHLKAANSSLQASEARYRTLVEAMPQLVWSTSADGSCKYLSQQWVYYTGIKEEDQLGDRWLQSLHPSDRDRITADWHAAVVNREAYEVEFRIRRHDGVYRWFKTRAVPLSNGKGTNVSWLGTCTDIDSEKEAAVALEKHTRHLEDLAFATAHHLQEPVRSIMLQTQRLTRLCEETLSGDGQQVASDMTASTRYLRELLRALMAYTELNVGALRLQSVNVKSLVQRALARWEADIREAGAIVTQDAYMPTVKADAVQLENVLQHLIGNALKYRDKSRVLTVHISAKEDKRGAVLSIADNGIGIDPQFHEQIFGLFKRLHTPAEYPGTGVGLALCQRIVELHGGRLWVESGKGAGATFRFNLEKPHEV